MPPLYRLLCTVKRVHAMPLMQACLGSLALWGMDVAQCQFCRGRSSKRIEVARGIPLLLSVVATCGWLFNSVCTKVVILADGTQLVVLVVPGALLEMSRGILRTTFATVLKKKVATFACERSSTFDSHLLIKLEEAKTSGAAVVHVKDSTRHECAPSMMIMMTSCTEVTVSTAVKSLMLRLFETMLKLQEKKVLDSTHEQAQNHKCACSFHAQCPTLKTIHTSFASYQRYRNCANPS
eukprot:36605-Amphidinium_carterae.1